MNVLLGNIIKRKLSELPYFDRAVGLVQTITKEDSANGGKSNTLKFPIEVNVAELKNSTPLLPDDSTTGMFYVEDGGIKGEGGNDYTSDLTLVCWFSPGKIASNIEAVSANIMADISEALFKGHFNEGPLTRLRFTPVSVPARDASIFSKYSYSEVQTQFLMPPYDFFAIRIKAGYRLSKSCLTPLISSSSC